MAVGVTRRAQTQRTLRGVYRALLDAYGPQHWWPAEDPFEVMVGAVLTQSTSWRNAASAIDCLKAAGAMTSQALRNLSLSHLASLVYSSGYYNAKARKLQALTVWLGEEYGDDIGRLAATETSLLRRRLLTVHGIGEETADSIILYAVHQPVFVIDAYTRRIVDRLGGSRDGSLSLVPKDDSYRAYQLLFMCNLPRDTALFNEYHALLVCHGKGVCLKNPRCWQCCLRDDYCHFSEGSKEDGC